MANPQQHGLMPNRPSDLGRLLGHELARLTDREEVRVKRTFPQHRERCQTCAFRAGTVPNGCEATLMDAIKCVVEAIPFYCHEQLDREKEPTALCAGYVLAQGMRDEPLRDELAQYTAAWDFSCLSKELGAEETQHAAT